MKHKAGKIGIIGADLWKGFKQMEESLRLIKKFKNCVLTNKLDHGQNNHQEKERGKLIWST